jgi:predicted TPR repeat methyltransferase
LSNFDKRAKDWDKSSRRFQVAKSFSDFVKDNTSLNKDYNLLDYGCGTGLVAYQFEDDVKSITGMDSSKKMIEQFLSKSNNEEHIKAFQHDINHEDLPQNSFDIIVSSMTLHHIENPEVFFQKTYKSLKQNGILAFADLDKEDGTFHDHGNDGVHHFGFEEDYIKDILKSNNFELIKFDFHFQIDKNDKEYKIFAAIAKKVD